MINIYIHTRTAVLFIVKIHFNALQPWFIHNTACIEYLIATKVGQRALCLLDANISILSESKTRFHSYAQHLHNTTHHKAGDVPWNQRSAFNKCPCSVFLAPVLFNYPRRGLRRGSPSVLCPATPLLLIGSRLPWKWNITYCDRSQSLLTSPR